VRRAIIVAAGLLALLIVPAVAGADLGLPTVDPTVPAARDTEPVVLTGKDFPGWSVPANQTVKVPLTDIVNCPDTNSDHCSHNHYADPEIDTARAGGPAGTPVDRILGYRWNARKHRFDQIPFQVDEMFTRYLENSASGFAFYSGDDQHTTYAFDREGWRFTDSTPSDPCHAIPFQLPDGSRPQTTLDPVKGLDTNDELAFMASDGGPAAPDGAKLPKGIQDVRRVSVVDPLTQATSYVYVMRAGDHGPTPAFNAANGYVRYARDANADTYERSVSSFSNYGNAAQGPYCDANGNLVTNPDGSPKIDKRRPRDFAWITTPRFRFRYDGRWLMTQLNVSPDGGTTYGPDLIDRWKARAFKQDPASQTPCCGYEEEDTNWGGSSTLLGERVGPVRAIRDTWGADSGTNVVREETFYRDEVRQRSWLRVHPIPPLDGIYAQWDFNAGIVNRFYNDKHPAGVAVDGSNDELYGNFDDPCNPNYDANDTSQIDQGYRSLYRQIQLCRAPDHLSIDPSDQTFSDANSSLGWSEIAGPSGTIVDRYQISRPTDVTPGGAAQSVLAVPYYRDDSCFDDGTGTDPGPKVHLRSGDEPRTYTDPVTGEQKPRRCWHPSDGLPNGSPAFFQGSIGTHGVHLLFLGESDNARQTVPLDEIVSEQRMVLLPGDPGNVGERYGRGFEKPLLTAVAPYSGAPAPDQGHGKG
jgi:hypothetical protein